MTIAEADGATRMSIESKFGGREGMEQVIEMGMGLATSPGAGPVLRWGPRRASLLP